MKMRLNTYIHLGLKAAFHSLIRIFGKHLTLTEMLKTRVRGTQGSGVSSTGISRIPSSAAHQHPQKGPR
ncbi:hypothetical protein EJB05_17738, partial [Eragrostis curvula]